jgi:hypothetical protein
MKVLGHCAAWVLAFCAVLLSPLALIYGVPLAIGAGADIVALGGGPIAAILLASATVCLLLRRTPAPAVARAALRSARSRGFVGRLTPGPVPPAAKSIG